MFGVWNINIHYDALLDTCVPVDAQRVCDVGCGDGFLAARLSRRVPSVVAVDQDAPVLERARARFPNARVTWVHDDVMTAALEPGSFDAVVSNATLHHLEDVPGALSRFASLLGPGGRLAIVAFVRVQLRDVPWQAIAWACRGVAVRVRGAWEHSAPISWPPPDTLRELSRHAAGVLPGVRIRRLLYGRVLLLWTAPQQPGLPSAPSGS